MDKAGKTGIEQPYNTNGRKHIHQNNKEPNPTQGNH